MYFRKSVSIATFEEGESRAPKALLNKQRKDIWSLGAFNTALVLNMLRI